MSKIGSLYVNFPFNQSSQSNLRDSRKSLTMGLRGSIRDKNPIYSNAFQQYLERLRSSEEHEESSCSSMEELIEEDSVRRKHKAPGAPSLRAVREHKETSLATATSLIRSIITDLYGARTEERHFAEITNYTVNTIVQDASSLEKLVEPAYRDSLEEQITELVNDKFIDVKHDLFFDTCTVFYLQPQCLSEPSKRTEQTQLFAQYADIFLLDSDSYRYFDRDFYQTEYFNIFKYSHNTMEEREVDEYLKRAIMMNLDKYMVYFSRALKEKRKVEEAYESEDSEDSEDSDESEECLDISGDDSDDENSISDGFVMDDSFVFAEEEQDSWSDGSEEQVTRKHPKIRFNESVSSIGIYPGEPAFYVYCDRHSIPIHEVNNKVKDD